MQRAVFVCVTGLCWICENPTTVGFLTSCRSFLCGVLTLKDDFGIREWNHTYCNYDSDLPGRIADSIGVTRNSVICAWILPMWKHQWIKRTWSIIYRISYDLHETVVSYTPGLFLEMHQSEPRRTNSSLRGVIRVHAKTRPIRSAYQWDVLPFYLQMSIWSALSFPWRLVDDVDGSASGRNAAVRAR